MSIGKKNNDDKDIIEDVPAHNQSPSEEVNQNEEKLKVREILNSSLQRVKSVSIENAGKSLEQCAKFSSGKLTHYVSSLLVVEDVKDPNALLSKLKGPDKLSEYLRRQILMHTNLPEPSYYSDEDIITEILVEELNILLQRREILYPVELLPQGELKNSSAKSLISLTSASPTIFLRLNRLLLQEAYPEDIRHSFIL
jgi:hypothetical protein